MFLNIFCLIALVLSVFVMVLSAIIAVSSHKSSKLAGDSIITPFHLFIIGFFVSAVFLFVPVTYSEFFVEDPAVIRGFKSLIFSVICTIRVFLVEFRRIVALRDKIKEEETDVIKYDYQILDDAHWLLSSCGFKIIKKT